MRKMLGSLWGKKCTGIPEFMKDNRSSSPLEPDIMVDSFTGKE
jgi:hypothetical protein